MDVPRIKPAPQQSHTEIDPDTILRVVDLRTYFKADAGIVKAVDGVSFELKRGETVGIVGESGCGKSVTNLSIMRLIQSPPGRIMSGQVFFENEDLLQQSEARLRGIRGAGISMIFQDPMTSLNPFLRVSTQLEETIMLHKGVSHREAHKRAIESLDMVGIPSPRERVNSYPHQFSGGMRQRVMIAMALSCEPKVLIADEPTTALDVTIQAQILELIQQLSRQLRTAVILVTHDLGVVAGMCDYIYVMYAGRIIERAPTEKLFHEPRHPYTQGLIRSVPRLDRLREAQQLFSIPGQPPNMIDLPDCCPFHTRCNHAMDMCRSSYPPDVVFSEEEKVACWLYENDMTTDAG